MLSELYSEKPSVINIKRDPILAIKAKVASVANPSPRLGD
jgi:hypothetical protein